MNSIEIKKDFIINGQPTKLLSGAVHYFRVVEGYWGYALDRLVELGANTVESYIPWNFHETEEGSFDFESANHDLEKFVQLAQERGLYVILRPSPYICAEWEFGGLPYWLLNKKCRIRTSDPRFLSYVERYFEVLLEKLAPLQWTQGGPVIMMQLENEYGSYGNDKEYLTALYQMMRKQIDVPIFTSDGAWDEALTAGYLPDSDVFPTGNFGSKSAENLSELKKFLEKKNIQSPLMCMEFWDGWFHQWNKDTFHRSPEEVELAVKELVELGSINLYMFQGGTNFGFMNGCNHEEGFDYPHTTTYDYDALLTEWGDTTEKFTRVQKVFGGQSKGVENHRKIAYPEAEYQGSASLFDHLDQLSTSPVTNNWPLPMEELNQGYGYLVYRSDIGEQRTIEKAKLIEADDRAKVYLNQKEVVTQYREEIGTEFSLELERPVNNELTILMENMGRVNYGPNLLAPGQKKGIRGGVMLDLHFHAKWEHYPIDLEKAHQLDYQKVATTGPAFHKFTLEVSEPADTFIDCRNWGKGCLFVNGFNLGRFWEVGPTGYLYLPAPLLQKGRNEFIVFETEGRFDQKLQFSDQPQYI